MERDFILDVVKAVVGVGFSLALLYMAFRFMNYSIAALARDTPYVTAGIMAAFFALLSLTGAVMIARDYVLYLKASSRKPEEAKP